MTLVWASGYNGIPDPDAQVYIAAVEAADGQTLEEPVQFAIHEFVAGCKYDGIWDAIKASCILAGARTLAGALVPLKGTAPTNFNFVAGDYDRETGLVGDGSTKYLDSNRNNNADPQNNNHNAVYASAIGTVSASQNRAFIGAGDTNLAGTNFLAQGITSGNLFARNRSSALTGTGVPATAGFVGASRSLSSQYTVRNNSVNTIMSTTSDGLLSANVLIFARDNLASLVSAFSDARLSFYSIGESLDLALLDARVSTLMTDIGAAIP